MVVFVEIARFSKGSPPSPFPFPTHADGFPSLPISIECVVIGVSAYVLYTPGGRFCITSTKRITFSSFF